VNSLSQKKKRKNQLSIPSVHPSGPRSHLNLISSVLDANWIYGTDKETADNLRTFKGGLLKSTPMFRQHGLKDLLPLKLDNPDDGCIRATPDTYCFMAGKNLLLCPIFFFFFFFFPFDIS
jgi:hypothetical protein